MKPAPFKVEIPEEQLIDLKRRLRATRWADDFGNAGWQYGVERGWLENMVRYWAEAFDWRAQEAAINLLPQYKVEIDGVPIHYVHAKGKGPKPMPIILTHGWPWTFWDWKDVIGPLSDPASYGGDPADAFDVIVPSLPGYGFSTPLRKTGVSARATAALWTRLMRDVLGYPKYAAAGGDWGAIVTSDMGHTQSDPLIGIYLTLPMIPGVNLREIPASAYAPDEAWMPKRAAEALPHISSHSMAHRHDAQTLAYALCDSPVGTAAWIWERRRNWADCPTGDPVDLFGRDFLCTTASIYWLTNSIGTSLRLYHEHFIPGWPALHNRMPTIPVPTGFGVSPKEVLMLPRSWAVERTNLKRWSLFKKGGHFGPAENAPVLIDEYRAFFRDLR